ncbi:AMP-binding protein [Polaribacter sp. Hel1_85]|uniref:AMP-binding protein n=1 Tax=Polaribacter sp. Hel1_85 TaxID=1250005 RepID=UPI00052CA1F5|nr:AMP-binding protein [Polaribacter sp. Hel1_85]KGL63969.1 O-succinylbenzoic acid-CoA ligase [Polaribacter sp. Hel1_85]
MKIERFHKDFKLNKVSFSSVDEILNYTRDFSDEIYQFLEIWFSKDDFILVKTSGSTGVPKEIKLLKVQMVNSALATGKYFDLKENTSVLLCLPIEYIAGKMMLIRALTLGWCLDVVEVNSNPLNGIQKKYDFSAMVPLQLENSINDLYKIKKLIVGGGVVSKQLQQKIKKSTCNIFATYGMTETITHIAVKKLNNLIVSPNFYQVLPNVKIYKDARSCLVINASEVSSEIVFTNDIVDLISDNQFDWLGRFDNVINSGGVKLHPERIEEKLSKIITARFFVAGVSDEKLGEKLVLVVEGKLEAIELKNVNLSKFEIPKEIYFVDAFIETKTKKIQRIKTLDLITF